MGEVEAYERIEVSFIPGHRPELVCFDGADAEVDRTDLTTFELPALRDMLEARGLVPTPAAAAAALKDEA